MERVAVVDSLLWGSHIEGELVRKRITSMQPYQIAEFEVGGHRGQWEKVGGPEFNTGHALRPLGDAKRHWRQLLNEKHGCVYVEFCG